MNCIPGVPLVFQGPDSKSYANVTYKAIPVTMTISKKFKTLDVMEKYGTTNPKEHLLLFTIMVNVNYLTMVESKSVTFKMFGKTLSGRALVWYSFLPKNSIELFNMLE